MITYGNSFEQKAIALTNQFRQSQGLPDLTVNWQLSRIARFKAKDMRDKNYAGHLSPTYGSPYDMMRTFGISFLVAAENVAGGTMPAPTSALPQRPTVMRAAPPEPPRWVMRAAPPPPPQWVMRAAPPPPPPPISPTTVGKNIGLWLLRRVLRGRSRILG